MNILIKLLDYYYRTLDSNGHDLLKKYNVVNLLWIIIHLLFFPLSINAFKHWICSSNNSLQAVELSGNSDLQMVVNSSLQTVFSTVFRIRVSLQRLS